MLLLPLNTMVKLPSPVQTIPFADSICALSSIREAGIVPSAGLNDTFPSLKMSFAFSLVTTVPATVRP
jgi:hypothetical protein